MIALVHHHLPQIRALCLKHRVRRLAIFGSGARGDFETDRSDLDFLVEFMPLAPVQYADSYFGLSADLEQLFGRPVDLVDVVAIRNPYLERGIATSQEILYGV